MKCKYLIVDQDGLEAVILFSPALLHQHVAGRNKVISAGYCKINGPVKWSTEGGSVSLNCLSRPQDVDILNHNLFVPLSFSDSAVALCCTP
jgi:hypothetical protein